MLVSQVARKIVHWQRKLRLALLGDRPSWRRMAHGFMMEIDPRDWPDQEMYLGTYEPGLQRLIVAMVRRGEAAIDVGTHKGFFTLLMARTVGATGRVLAADPDPRAFAALDANCKRNQLDQVLRSQVAVAEADGWCEIALSRQLGWSSRFPNELAQPTVVSKVRVATRTLDGLLLEHGFQSGPRVTFVKLDAEGSEPMILAGMGQLVERSRPAVFLEINPGSLAVAESSAAQLGATLSAWGYLVFAIATRRDRLGRIKVSLTPAPLGEVTGRAFDALALDPSSDLYHRVRSMVV